MLILNISNVFVEVANNSLNIHLILGLIQKTRIISMGYFESQHCVTYGEGVGTVGTRGLQ